MSAALVALAGRIATNTLTAWDISALTAALSAITPTFPVPDGSGVSLYSDEDEAREWIAALYTIQAGGGTGPVTLQRVITPTTVALLPAPFEPTSAGKILFVIDITPQSNLILVSVNVDLISDGAGVPGLNLVLVPLLTAVTGGTVIAPGITAEATSTTPAVSTGTEIVPTEAPTFDDGSGNPHSCILVVASAPVTVIAGQRYGIVCLARDTSTQNWTSIAAAISAIAQ
jgi:hypothetical protein